MQIQEEILEALVRIEKKLDEVLNRQDSGKPIQLLSYDVQVCPMCKKLIKYEPYGSTVIRRCGCHPHVKEQPTKE